MSVNKGKKFLKIWHRQDFNSAVMVDLQQVIMLFDRTITAPSRPSERCITTVHHEAQFDETLHWMHQTPQMYIEVKSALLKYHTGIVNLQEVEISG